MPSVASVSIRLTEVSSIDCTSATTASHTTTSSRASASPMHVSDASAKRGSPMSTSRRTEESRAIMDEESAHGCAGSCAGCASCRITGGAAARGAHGLIGGFQAVDQLELAAHLAQRLADVLAQDDAAAV